MKSRYIVTMAILALAFAMLALPVYADLVPTSYGFPVIVQNGSTSSYNQNTANAADYEAININYDGSVVPFGPVNLTFPDISQVSDQTQSETATNFARTNEYAEYSYPFESVGSASLPSFGFNF